jgi:hypothetical protein
MKTRNKFWVLCILTVAVVAGAQVPINGSIFSGNYSLMNYFPASIAGTSAGYTGWGKNGSGDMDFAAANSGASPSFYWYFLLGSSLTAEMYLDSNANFHVPNGGITTQSLTATVSANLPHCTVAALPSPVTLGVGGSVIVTDCTSYTPGPLCTGGGSDVMVAVSNGTVWTVH